LHVGHGKQMAARGAEEETWLPWFTVTLCTGSWIQNRLPSKI